MDYTSDSDVSDDTRDLVMQGLASVRRKRTTTALQSDRVYERFPVPNMDNYNIRHPLYQEGINGASSTHGLNMVAKESGIGQNRNSINQKKLKYVTPSWENLTPIFLYRSYI